MASESANVQGPAETPPSLLARFWFPLAAVIVLGSIFATPWICLAFDVHDETISQFFMPAVYFSPMLLFLVLSVWWVFFYRGIEWVARLGVWFAAVALLGGIGAGVIYAAVRKVEFTMSPVGLVPRFHFNWETTAETLLAKELDAEKGKVERLEPINATIGPTDFPAYRGRHTDGVVTFAFARLEPDWSKKPPEVLWRKSCPGGYSGVAVAGNIVVTLQQQDDIKKEVVVCYDRATGVHRWRFPYDAYYKDGNLMGDGPRSTPTIDNNHIYTIGATGQLVCLTVEGKLKWTHDILEIAKAKNVKWGLTGSPLIVDDLVIAHAGIDPEAPRESALIAFEQTTGKIRWQVGKRPAGYSSPQLATLDGVSQILLFDGAGLVSYDPKTGTELWHYPWVTKFEMNNVQPVVVGNDRVMISSEIENGAAMLRLKAPKGGKAGWTVDVAWKHKRFGARFANPVTDGKFIYGLHHFDGNIICLDADTGDVRWKGNRLGPGQLLLADGTLIVVHGHTGEVMLFEASGSQLRELSRAAFLMEKDKTWNTPAFAGNQLFIRNQAEIVCVRLPIR